MRQPKSVIVKSSRMWIMGTASQPAGLRVSKKAAVCSQNQVDYSHGHLMIHHDL